MVVPVKVRKESWEPIRKEELPLLFDYGISVERDPMADRILAFQLDASLLGDDEWLQFRLATSKSMLKECIAVDPDIRGGVPVLRGTRISISQIFAEISGYPCIVEFAVEYDIDADIVRKLFEGMAIQFDRSFVK